MLPLFFLLSRETEYLKNNAKITVLYSYLCQYDGIIVIISRVIILFVSSRLIYEEDFGENDYRKYSEEDDHDTEWKVGSLA